MFVQMRAQRTQKSNLINHLAICFDEAFIAQYAKLLIKPWPAKSVIIHEFHSVFAAAAAYMSE